MFNLIYRLILADLAPDVLDEAVEYQLVTHDLDERHQPTNTQLTPEVAYSLGLIQDLPEDDTGIATGSNH